MREHGHLKTTAFIMMSADLQDHRVLRSIELGAKDFLPKPVNKHMLLSHVQTAMDNQAERMKHSTVARDVTRKSRTSVLIVARSKDFEMRMSYVQHL